MKRLVDELLISENAVLYPAPGGDVIQWYAGLQDELGLKPYVKFDKTHKYLSQASYSMGDDSLLFFIANTSLSKHISVNAEFLVEKKLRPWLWNPETGERSLYPTNGSNNRIRLELPRATSVLLIFGSDTEGKQFQPVDFNRPGKKLTGPWQLQLNHMNGEKKQMVLNTLSDLMENKQAKTFAGDMIYEKTIKLDSDKYQYIDLGDVQGISELTINGKHVGTKWYGAHIYDISKVLEIGENSLTIKLTTILGNYLKSLKDNPVAWEWTRRQDYYPMGILGPVSIL